MILPDTNLLLYAYDTGVEQHDAAKTWLKEIMKGPIPVGIPWIVCLAFVRLVTHPTLLHHPMGVKEAKSVTTSWLRRGHVRLLCPGDNTFALFFKLLEEAKLGGNLATDALIAAHAMEWGGTVYSNDRDFGRFSSVRWENPLS